MQDYIVKHTHIHIVDDMSDADVSRLHVGSHRYIHIFLFCLLSAGHSRNAELQYIFQVEVFTPGRRRRLRNLWW